MKQEDVAGKILAELLELGIATKENDWIIYEFLMQAYAAGYDKGRKVQSRQVPVVQYSMDGEFINAFDSAADAGRAVKRDSSDIIRCCKGKARSAGGFRWGYVNEKKPTSSSPREETIGAYLKQLTREARKNRSSKKD